MRASHRRPCRKSTSCFTSTETCCPAMTGTMPSSLPAPSLPWHSAQRPYSCAPCSRFGVRSIAARNSWIAASVRPCSEAGSTSTLAADCAKADVAMATYAARAREQRAFMRAVYACCASKQQRRRQPEEYQKPHAVRDGGQEDAAPHHRVAPHPLEDERAQHARDGGDQHVEAHGERHDGRERQRTVEEKRYHSHQETPHQPVQRADGDFL